jgi:hypothetical protein
MHTVTTVTQKKGRDHKGLSGGRVFGARREGRQPGFESRFSATICSSANRPTATAWAMTKA